MRRSTKRGAGCVVFLACWAALVASEAQAGGALQVTAPTITGVLASLNDNDRFTPIRSGSSAATSSGGVSSNLALLDGGRRVSYTARVSGTQINDDFFASTAFDNGTGASPGLNLLIVGTAGEASGTPVTLTLFSQFNGTGDGATILSPQLSVNHQEYGVNGTYTITGLGVGSFFNFVPQLSGYNVANATFDVSLTVSAVGTAPMAAPEPGTAVLVASAGILLFVPRRVRVRSRRARTIS